MTGQKTLKSVLVESAGRLVDLCIIPRERADAKTIHAELTGELKQYLVFSGDAVYNDAVHVDEVNLWNPQLAHYCADCLRGLCQRYQVRTVTVLPTEAEEPFEFEVDELLNAA